MMHYTALLTTLLSLLSSTTALAIAIPGSSPNGIFARSGKPTGGPASAKITIYSGPYTCQSLTMPPDGSAGTSTIVNVAETQCGIIPIPLNGAITATMTAAPKSGTAGCYVQIFTQSGCGLTLENQYHGFPFDGVIVGSKVGCVQPPGVSYGAVEIVCE